ncbi:zinc finger protein 622-like [Stylonychia lemnae]|uniref:Zinc finger protein 622-like n=1 Tax=Stylonychia lemnae TaxID=5949 RepID=A0A078ATL2_STYLE|nr:zinc finger protein 622-like [Stylonychia lemnae]|eukprot:CDW85331.1 zinc finger protein 622-like [Stylonychia lemnae]
MDYKLHIITDFHVFNIKRKILALEPVTEEIFEQKKATIALSEINSQQSDLGWKCYPCKKTFKSMEQLDQHQNSKNHKKNDKIYKAQNANPLENSQQSSMFENLTKDNLSKHLNDDKSQEINLSKSDHPNDHNDSHNLDPTRDHQEQQEKQKMKDDMNDSKLPQRTSLDTLRICLFCNKELGGVKKCLDHMRSAHSFFILDIDCCINLKGLLTYIAERIQLGYLCLFCNKMFKNSRRCQQHMMDKSHCFMSVNDEHEYQLFYDFSKLFQLENSSNSAQVENVKQSDNVDKKQEDNSEFQNIDMKDLSLNQTPQKNNEDAWEDVDLEDANEEELKMKDIELIMSTPSKSEKSESEHFSIISESNGQTESSQPNGNGNGTVQSQSDFTLINPQSNTTEVKNSFQSNKQFCAESVSSIKGPTQEQTGLSRNEAWQRLNIGQPELLETGEIRLPNGKIIGPRDMKYIYNQRYKPEDSRDSVILAKLQVEYRKMKALTNGNERELFKNSKMADEVMGQLKARAQREQNSQFKTALNGNKLQVPARVKA